MSIPADHSIAAAAQLPVWSRRSAARLFAAFSLGLLLQGRRLYAEAPGATTVSWQTLQTLDLNTPIAGQKTPVLGLSGKLVAIPGFMVPLEDSLETVSEFLLVPYAGACIHVPPPPPNQIVYVKMNKSVRLHVTFTDPILVTGTLRITTVQSPYGAVSYSLAGDTVAPYQAG